MDRKIKNDEIITTGNSLLTSEIFLLRVCTVVMFVVVMVISGGERDDSSLRQQVLQLTAQQIQQRLHHLRTQLVCIRPVVPQT